MLEMKKELFAILKRLMLMGFDKYNGHNVYINDRYIQYGRT